MEKQNSSSKNISENDNYVDLVTLEIIRGKLVATAEEMGLVLAKSSMSPVIYEVLDFACGICTVDGQLISQTNGITVFTGIFETQVRAVLNKFDGQIHPNDVFLMNNPFEGGTHLCDICLIRPIFYDSNLAAFAIAVAHWSEVGGMTAGSLPTNATEVFQEGLRIPVLKFVENDEINERLLDLILANSRLPENCLGDLNAQLASVKIADLRLVEIFDKYGRSTTLNSFREILLASEKLSRIAISKLPDGTYTATDYIDGDGIAEERYQVNVKVTISGDEIIVDFTGCCDQLQGPVNCSRSAMVSAVKTVMKAVVGPQAPSNDGWFRPLKVLCPDKTVFTAEPPAAVGWYYEATGHASELVWKALAPLLEESFSTGSANSLCVSVLAGVSLGGDQFVLVEPGMVGWGATNSSDGASVVSAITNGDTFNYSIELLEAKFPLRLRKYELNLQGGSGAGRYRGGYGAVREYEILAKSATLSASFGRSIAKPWGMFGGSSGSNNRIEIIRGGEEITGARLPAISLKEGDIVRFITGGGGGFGQAEERPFSLIEEDVLGGYISKDKACSDYNVIFSTKDKIDASATKRQRELVK